MINPLLKSISKYTTKVLNRPLGEFSSIFSVTIKFSQKKSLKK